MRGPVENRQARSLYEKVVEIDPRFARAYAGLAMTYAIDHRLHDAAPREQDLHRARALAQTARQIDPDIAEVHWALAFVDVQDGHPRVALAMHLKPDAGYLYYLLLGRAYLFQGEVDQALINLKQAVARNPADLESHLYLAAASAAAGDRAAADWQAQEVRTLDRDFEAGRWLSGYPMTSAPQRARLQALLAKAGLP